MQIDPLPLDLEELRGEPLVEAIEVRRKRAQELVDQGDEIGMKGLTELRRLNNDLDRLKPLTETQPHPGHPAPKGGWETRRGSRTARPMAASTASASRS